MPEITKRKRKADVMTTNCTYCGKQIVRKIYPSKGVPNHPYCSVDCRLKCMREERVNDRW